MKRYYNENNEEFKLERGSLKEINNYAARTNVYLYYDTEKKHFYASFASILVDNETNKRHYGMLISPLDTKETLAHKCGYYEY